MSEPQPIRQATFNPKVVTYWLLSTTLILTVTVVGIPLLVLWLPLGTFVCRRYLGSKECTLYPKSLKVRKGIFTQIEKTIPLEKITDMGTIQGPIMRRFGLHTLSVETAGQSGTGALVSLTGIENALDFREAVLDQRDRIQEKQPLADPAHNEGGIASSGTAEALLIQIRDTLQRIEEKLDRG